MNTVELIRRKRDGTALSPAEITWLIDHYTDGSVTDYQMAAMTMAIFFNGLNSDELATWTEAMLHSGEVLDLAVIPGKKVDKHSTGGVGDKVSIPLAPMVAAAGVRVPMMSGRGLGHTGGTLDKLETIPGFTTQFDPNTFAALLARNGLVLAGQSETLVPADRKLYALRDATGTVESIPLIASSIMSKKLAEDLDGLVLDVKVGRGAFMRDRERARLLARTMVGIGAAHDVPVVALLTPMEQPLGREVGNASEIVESLAVLRGEGPRDLTEITLRLGEEMLILGGITKDRREARNTLEATISSGSALTKFAEVIEAQGGDPRVVENPDILPQPAHRTYLPATRGGVVTRCDAFKIGVGAMHLGAGRERKEDVIDPAVGVTVLAKEGDVVAVGEPLAAVAWNDEGRLEDATRLLADAWEIGDEPPEPLPHVLEEVR
ncbi:MAG: thymidine phosphorylase [Actinobacteria bacterium]|nr:thymidine phosphorylase [Actinomycetota bacterium]